MPADADDPRLDFDRIIGSAFQESIERLETLGITEDQRSGILSQALGETINKEAVKTAQSMMDRAAEWAARCRGDQFGFNERLRLAYGPALDASFGLVFASWEMGAHIAEQHDGEQDSLVAVLLNLQARACLVGFEVHSLLSNGFPKGAHARARTLHEIAVTALVIGQHGREPEHTDLAQRYLDHAEVLVYQDAKAHNDNADVLDMDRITDDDMADMEARYRELLSLHGPWFKGQYGWAANLVGRERFNFTDLAAQVDMDYLHGRYRIACHQVHADARGMLLDFFDQGVMTYGMAGPTSAGFSDPASHALHSLNYTSLALAFYRREEMSSPLDMLRVSSFTEMYKQIGALFEQGERAMLVYEQGG